MVHELAEYERAAEECHLTEEQLHASLFGDSPALFGHVAARPDEEPVGFALWFLNYSTWLGVHGIYLEDLYVRPEARGAGLGRDLLAALAQICLDRGYGRLEWCGARLEHARPGRVPRAGRHSDGRMDSVPADGKRAG